MYRNATHQLPYIRNYEEAERWFNKTKPCRGKGWLSNQRPLKGSQFWHYRLEKNDDCYDVYIYRTRLARYYKPLENGERNVIYWVYDSASTRSFYWNVLYKRMEGFTHEATNGKTVYVPLFNGVHWAPDDAANLWFDKEGKLIVEKSQHTPVGYKVASPELKLQRKAVRANVTPVVEAMVLQYETLKNERPSPGGGPFWPMRGMLRETGVEFGQEHMQTLLKEAQYAVRSFRGRYRTPWYRMAAAARTEPTSTEEIYAQLRKYLHAHFQDLAYTSTKFRDAIKPVPMFPEVTPELRSHLLVPDRDRERECKTLDTTR